MNKKTTFIILGIVILVALIAIGIILRKPTTAPIETPITPSEEAAEEAIEEIKKEIMPEQDRKSTRLNSSHT